MRLEIYPNQKLPTDSAEEPIFRTASSSFKEEQYENIKYRLSKPESYLNKTTAEKYPLLVYLHGAGERGSDNRKSVDGLNFLGNGSSTQAKAFQDKFPCFVYVPQCPAGSSWEGETLRNVIRTIEHIKSTYPVDQNRLYLIGYSMGGTGTYELACKYYDYNAQLFAGIIRIAGQSSFGTRVHNIIAKSAIWIHVGLRDTPLRVEKAREAYSILKTIFDNPPEKIQKVDINGQQGKTSILIVDNQERVKLTEYTGVGHDINFMPFDDPAVLEWLFEQKIK